jgi:zinc protease
MLANLLGAWESVASWKLLAGYLDGIRKVTAADVQRVARLYLTPDNRTTAVLIPTKPGAAAASGGPGLAQPMRPTMDTKAQRSARMQQGAP